MEDPTATGGSDSSAIPDHTHHKNFSVGTLKLVLTFCILALGLVSVFTPRRLTGAPALFSLGNMMASGVLLSAGLVHQLAESAQVLNRPEEFPWAMFVAGLTFLLFLVVEESLHLILGGGAEGGDWLSDPTFNPLNLHEMMHNGIAGGHDHSHGHGHGHGHGRDHGLPQNYTSHDDKGNDENEQSFSLISSSTPHKIHSTNQQHHDDEEPDDLQQELGRSSEQQPLIRCTTLCTSATIDSCFRMSISYNSAANLDSSNHNLHNNTSQSLAGPSNHTSTSARQRRHSQQLGSFLQSTKSHKEDPLMLAEHHHHDEHIDLHLHGSILASGILMLALSIHSILAGISIGIESNVDTITGTAIAILAHKSFEGFCLGSSLVNAQLDHLPFLVLGISFSLATPMGIVTGQLLMNGLDTGKRGQVMIAVVQAIVAGTFLYIAIVEIGAKELLVCREDVPAAARDNLDQQIALRDKLKRQRRIDAGKLACFAFGFLAMSALAALI